MRLDIYRRPERNGQFSYLAVPEGRPIPEEANNTEWEYAAQGLDMMEPDAESELAIEGLEGQIDTKGYAITSVRHLRE